MAAEQTVHKKLEYLVHITGRRESEVLAEALEQGMNDIYCKQVASAYAVGTLSREEAVLRLGEKTVAELDYAWQAIVKDVEWGMRGE